ncbi:hypothetical protein BaRGS_00010093, partial [Batillaria attramentaria]
LCSLIRLENGIGHLEFAPDPAQYVQCEAVGHEVRFVVRFCPYGAMWNPAKGACDRPIETATDPCRGQADGTRRQYGLTCVTYWECQGQVSTPQCCPSGQSFNSATSMCEVNAACTDACPANSTDFSTPAPFCPYILSPVGPEYYRIVETTQITDVRCPDGEVFSILCTCIAGAATPTVSADLSINFDNSTIEDASGNRYFVRRWPDPAFFTYPNQQMARFIGVNYLIVPGLANQDFRDSFATNLVFTPSGSIPNSQVLLHNGPDNDPLGPTVKISIMDSATLGMLDVTFLVVTQNDVMPTPIVLTVPKSGPLDVRMSYNGTEVVAEVYSGGSSVASGTRMTTGQIPLRVGGFNIGGGACLGCNNFIGTMDCSIPMTAMFDMCLPSPAASIVTMLSTPATTTPAPSFLALPNPTPADADVLYLCPYSASAMGPGFFSLGGVDVPCPTGTQFSTINCGCTVLVSGAMAGCSTFLNATFDSTLNATIDNSANKLFLEDVFITYVNNMGIFNGIFSEVKVPGFANLEFGDNFTFSITFQNTASTVSPNTNVVGNGYLGLGTTSLGVKLQDAGSGNMNIQFELRTVNSGLIELTLTGSKTSLWTATLNYNSPDVTASINDGMGTVLSTSATATGPTLPLQRGRVVCSKKLACGSANLFEQERETEWNILSTTYSALSLQQDE